ncbi:MAG: hypothetical protein ACJAUH_000731 [Saprospiraceae bacterium]|jgi:hypothetical protein
MLKIQEFSNLTDLEAKSLYQAPAMIAVLIASADSNIEEKETAWAKKVMNFRQEVGKDSLFNYYEIADSYFSEELRSLLSDDKGTQERLSSLEGALTEMNVILAKIDADFAMELVQSWRSFAQQVAKATGGILGFGSISEQEKHLMGLKMISL